MRDRARVEAGIGAIADIPAPPRISGRNLPLMLRSGDVIVMGGRSRLRYHGVTRIFPGTAPEGTGPGRFNLTFRQYDP